MFRENFRYSALASSYSPSQSNDLEEVPQVESSHQNDVIKKVREKGDLEAEEQHEEAECVNDYDNGLGLNLEIVLDAVPV